MEAYSLFFISYTLILFAQPVMNLYFCLIPLNLSPQALICLVDKKTGEKSKTRPRFVKQDQVCIARLRAAGVICLETFKDFPQMGRFTLRDEGEAPGVPLLLKSISLDVLTFFWKGI